MSYTINSTIKAKYYGGVRDVNSIKYIVIHYTANSGTTATAKGNANYFHTCSRKASAHYIVDENSIIYQCVPDNYIAYAVGGSLLSGNGGSLYNICTNANSLSIEMVSHSNANGYYIPEVTENRTIELIYDLQKKYPNAITICRHYDVTNKLCPRTHCDTSTGEQNWKNFLNKLKSSVVETKQVSLIGYVKVNNLNVRSQPDMSSQLIEQMNIGKSIYITEETNTGWVKFEDGWVKKEYLTIAQGFETINDIVYELYSRKILSDRSLWVNILNQDINVYYLAKATCNKTINCMYPKSLNTVNDVLWELSDSRHIMTDKDLWKKKMSENNNVFCLAKNIANLTDNR